MTFRHPIDRLYSAFKGKILTQKRLIAGVNKFTDFPPKFNNFMKYVSETNEYNIHWSPNTVICNPCQYGFDYHIKMENFKEEVIEMFKGQNASVENQKDVLRSGHSYYKDKDILNNLDKNVLDAFLQRFELDFLLFGYDINV